MKNLARNLLISMLLIPISAFTQTKVGTTAAAFMQIGTGGRSAAMGETAGADALDVSAIFWNPALAATIPTHQVYFNHIDWFADINLEYGSVLLSLGNLGNIAASFYTMNSGQIAVTSEERPEGTGEKYTVQDLMVGLSYMRSLTDRFSIGGTFKLIRSSIWNMSASAMAMDIGLGYQTPFKPVAIAMSIVNFGSEMQMRGTDTAIRFDPDPRVRGNNDAIVAYQATRSWDLPVSFRFGLTYKLLNRGATKLLVNSDVLYPNNNENYVNLGAEYRLYDIYFLRAGYRKLFLAEREGGLTLGAGLVFRNIQFDYTYADWERLGFVQYLGIGFRF